MSNLTNTQIEQFANNTLIRNNINARVTIVESEDWGKRNLMSIAFAKNEIQLGKDIFNFMTNAEILACICHELGHIGHATAIPVFGNHFCEHEADERAIKYGANGEDLISALTKTVIRNGHNPDKDSETHPSLTKRAKNIRQWVTFYSLYEETASGYQVKSQTSSQQEEL